jgi:DNA-binding CsgD family transcriptional regulator
VSGGVTPREQAVLDLLGEQLTHREIGRRRFISPRTVESHVASLRRKLDLPDHRALVRLAAAQRNQSLALPALAVPLTPFIGRTRELAELAAALDTARAGAGYQRDRTVTSMARHP